MKYKLNESAKRHIRGYFAGDEFNDIQRIIERTANDVFTENDRFTLFGFELYVKDFDAMTEEDQMIPEHYRKACGTIEPRMFLKGLPFQLGNACKYLLRYNYKGKPVEDLRKALDYLVWARDEDETPAWSPISFELAQCFENAFLPILFSQDEEEGNVLRYDDTIKAVSVYLDDLTKDEE